MILSDKKLELTPNNQVYRAYWYNLCEGSKKIKLWGPDFLNRFLIENLATLDSFNLKYSFKTLHTFLDVEKMKNFKIFCHCLWRKNVEPTF